MTFRNRYLFIAVTIVCIIGLIQQWRIHNKSGSDYDAPKILSGVKETLLLRHVKRNCDCADWISVTLSNDSTKIKEDDYIFVEPASTSAQIPAYFLAIADHGYSVRLEGEFYKEKTIPDDYIPKTNEKPVSARVFYYTSYEVIKPE
ncbi:MAG: hypothetical protein JST75_02905 [Bacteroidetes bacterium]|nr:hypothetical protein [Bacteroidota bacterium]